MNRVATLTLLGLTACRPVINYLSPVEPRYAGALPTAARVSAAETPATLRVVTYNVQFARHVDRAIVISRE